MVAERLSKVEESLNHALGVGELRQRLDEMIKARESAMTDATKARQEAQVIEYEAEKQGLEKLPRLI